MSANRVEKLVYWYLRFNGYLTVENFTVHPNYKKSSEAEADILAVRFPNSKEDPRRFQFERDPKFILNDHVDFVIGEVKTGLCTLNPSWEESGRENIQYALAWFGFLKDLEIDPIAKEIYQHKIWQNGMYSVRLICFGERKNTDLYNIYPKLLQMLHQDMVEFIYNRLTTHCMALHRENWDAFIREISSRIETGSSSADLLNWVMSKE
jgi:hypothetical protein